MISIIVALTSDRAIGKEGQLLYPISADLKRFKALTMGHPIVMGRHTYESLPNGPLPGRENIVLTTKGLNDDRPTVFSSLDVALAHIADSDAFIIGGAKVYEQALPLAHRLYLTEILTVRPDADAFFPEIDPEEWMVVEESETFTDPRSGVPYRFTTLERVGLL
ncbi:MAG: dihydrofolate reductase [Bacteroidales bacterium]|nr:dihydrofolate reductase [Bacteroidales bacterium]MCD8394786.1 dihydrofolate reductase [Bacteroidales bacterium]